MIFHVSEIMQNKHIKDYCKIAITRQEININNNQIYDQEVSGSYESVKWFRDNILEQIKKQKSKIR